MLIGDRVFVVTGASSGIGEAIARELADQGGRVALVARRANRLKKLAKELGPTAAVVPVDVTTGDAPDLIHDATIDAFGAVHGLVNCAGRGLAGQIADLDPELLDEAFELNLVAPIRLIQRLVKPMLLQSEGTIVNVSSPTARLGLPGIAGYAMTKSALDALTVALRRELFGTGVHVMAAYPGATESGFYDQIMGDVEDSARPRSQPAAVVARAIVRGIVKRRREVWALSSAERRRIRMIGLMGRLSPTALDRGMAPRR